MITHIFWNNILWLEGIVDDIHIASEQPYNYLLGSSEAVILGPSTINISLSMVPQRCHFPLSNPAGSCRVRWTEDGSHWLCYNDVRMTSLSYETTLDGNAVARYHLSFVGLLGTRASKDLTLTKQVKSLDWKQFGF